MGSGSLGYQAGEVWWDLFAGMNLFEDPGCADSFSIGPSTLDLRIYFGMLLISGWISMSTGLPHLSKDPSPRADHRSSTSLSEL